MKKYVAISVMMLFLIGYKASAQEYKMALGVRLSSAQATINNSVSFKYFLNENSALEGLLSFDPAAVGVLYEFHRPLGSPGFQWFFGAFGKTKCPFHTSNSTERPQHCRRSIRPTEVGFRYRGNRR